MELPMIAFAFKNLTVADQAANVAKQFSNRNEGKSILALIGSATSARCFVNACLANQFDADTIKDHGNEMFRALLVRRDNPTATKAQRTGAMAGLDALNALHAHRTSAAPVAPVVAAPVAPPVEAVTLSKAVKPTAATNAADIKALTAMMMQMNTALNTLVERS
jgi:hypothetical protein